MMAIGPPIRSPLHIPRGHCSGDIRGPERHYPDGVVNVDDLLAALNNWSDPGEPCHHSDANGSGMVTVDDLLLVLNNSGACPGYPAQQVPSLEDELIAAGLTTEDWDDYMTVMSSDDELRKENWTCWMKRRLTGCSNCQPCPGPEPF